MYKKNNYKHNSGDHKPVSEKAMEKFAALMIKRMEEMEESHWKKGWTDGASCSGLPQNIRGGVLGGSNAFFLQLHTALEGYSMPVYLTFLQVNDLGLSIKKGSESVPVIFWDTSYIEKLEEGEKRKPEKLTWEQYRLLSPEEQEKYERRSILRAYPEFNVDQTNLCEVKPELYQKLQERFKAPEIKDAEGMYSNAAIDRMLQEQAWVCPIKYDQQSRSAFYRPSTDEITVPMKSQFNISDTPEGVYQDGMEWYSTTIHEMAHSTGHPDRLNREKGGRFGDDKYGKEELVAEMTAAVVGSTLGFSYRIVDNNTNYIKDWADNIRKEPKFLLSVVTDVGKASNMILDKINEQKVALGEKPIIDSTPLLAEEDSKTIRLEALEPRAVDMIVKRASDPKAKAFTQGQREVIGDYLKAAADVQGQQSVDDRCTLLTGIFAKAELKLKEMNISKAWIEDARKETMDLAEGVTRNEERGLRR